MERNLSEGRKIKYKKTKLHVMWDGETVEGKTDRMALHNALIRFANACGSMDKVVSACKGLHKDPTVMTSETAAVLKGQRKWLEDIILPFSNPSNLGHSVYSYLAVTENKDKKQRLESLAGALGISDRVKVYLL